LPSCNQFHKADPASAEKGAQVENSHFRKDQLSFDPEDLSLNPEQNLQSHTNAPSISNFDENVADYSKFESATDCSHAVSADLAKDFADKMQITEHPSKELCSES